MIDTYWILQAIAGCPTITRMSGKELQEWLNKQAPNDPCFWSLDDFVSDDDGGDLTGLGGTMIIRGEEFRPTKKEIVTEWEV